MINNEVKNKITCSLLELNSSCSLLDAAAPLYDFLSLMGFWILLKEKKMSRHPNTLLDIITWATPECAVGEFLLRCPLAKQTSSHVCCTATDPDLRSHEGEGRWENFLYPWNIWNKEKNVCKKTKNNRQHWTVFELWVYTSIREWEHDISGQRVKRMM